MLIGVLGWTLIGMLGGYITSRMVKLRGDDPSIGIVCGTLGAVIGGWLFSIITGSVIQGFNLWSMLCAAIGGGAAIFAWHRYRKHPLYRN